MCYREYWQQFNLTAILVLLSQVMTVGLPVSSTAADPTPKYALVDGCSHYIHLPNNKLNGPINDVEEVTKALVKHFGFPTENVRRLVGWPDDVSQRPTRENIVREFQWLKDNVTTQSQVVIYLSGHGIRVPIPESQTNPLDPSNPEPDGFDEAFVSADAHYADGQLKNLIMDNELGVWLDAIRNKDAHVWALFDCCHSGTMDRGASNEHSRELRAKDLGVPDDVYQRAIVKGDKISQRNVNEGGPAGKDKPEGLVDSTNATVRKGTQVSFYAAQPFETAPDLPRPMNAPPNPENYFGLLTYTTLQSLLQPRQTSQLTYRELGQLITNRYRAERGTCGPTPTFAGDLDREVLGLRSWPGRSQIILRKGADKWYVSAGELQGISTGSILSLHAMQGISEGKSEIGFVRVSRSMPTTSQVEPCEFGDRSPVAIDKLQELMRCEVVTRHLGDLRLRLAIAAADAETRSLMDIARTTLGQVRNSVAGCIEVLDEQNAGRAEWELSAVSPKIAESRFRWRVAAPRIILARVGESPIGDNKPDEANADGRRQSRAYKSYDPKDEEAFRTALEADLLKIFTFQNLLRLACRECSNPADPSSDVKVELFRGGELLIDRSVVNGQQLELRIKNDGTDRIWVTPMLLSPDFEVYVLPTSQLNRPGSEGDELKPISIEVRSEQPGTQAWIVIVSSAELNKVEPDFRFLAQSSLGKSPRVTASFKASMTPFEVVTMAIAGQKGGFRGDVPMSEKNPAMVIRSWETVRTKGR